MELEELQRQWQGLDDKLEQALKLQRAMLHQSIMPTIRRRIYGLAIWRALDTAFALVVLVLVGSFVGAHWTTWSLVGPAAILIASAAALLIDSMRELARASEIDWGGAVVAIQIALSQLRIAKIIQFKRIILLSPLVGFCSFIVGLQWLMDWLPVPPMILDKLNPWWVAGNYAFGVLFIPFGHILVRLLAPRFRGRGWWQKLLDGISGTSLQKAERELDRWASLGGEALGPEDERLHCIRSKR